MPNPNAAPRVTNVRNHTIAAALGADAVLALGEATEDATVTKVVYVPEATITGANTNSRTLSLVNKGQDGTGTTVIATLAFVSGVNVNSNDEILFTLSGTPANLLVSQGDVLEFQTTHVGTGIADPGGYCDASLTRR